jgi:hypothetical protein
MHEDQPLPRFPQFGEHVQLGDRIDSERFLQNGEVSREGGGIAGNVNQLGRSMFDQRFENHFAQTGRRPVDYDRTLSFVRGRYD